MAGCGQRGRRYPPGHGVAWRVPLAGAASGWSLHDRGRREQHMASKTHSVSGELLRMGVAAAVGAAAAYGGRALWKQLPALMASTAAGQVGRVADKVKGGAVEGASRVAGEARQNASQAASTPRGTKRAASSGGSAARRTTSSAHRASSGGSSAEGRTRKPAWRQ